MPAWSKEAARLAALKSAQTRAALAENRKRAIKQAESNPFQAHDPQPAQPEVNQEPKPKPDTFNALRLVRVRKQLTKLDSMLSSACDEADLDAGHIDKLASAIARLSEIERQLADRPLPGSKRPAQDKPQQSRASILLGGVAESGSGRIEQE